MFYGLSLVFQLRLKFINYFPLQNQPSSVGITRKTIQVPSSHPARTATQWSAQDGQRLSVAVLGLFPSLSKTGPQWTETVRTASTLAPAWAGESVLKFHATRMTQWLDAILSAFATAGITVTRTKSLECPQRMLFRGWWNAKNWVEKGMAQGKVERVVVETSLWSWFGASGSWLAIQFISDDDNINLPSLI